LEPNKIAGTTTPVPRRQEPTGSADALRHIGSDHPAPLASDRNSNQQTFWTTANSRARWKFPAVVSHQGRLVPTRETTINRADDAGEGDTRHHRSLKKWQTIGQYGLG
jgi:hypothetical protein